MAKVRSLTGFLSWQISLVFHSLDWPTFWKDSGIKSLGKCGSQNFEESPQVRLESFGQLDVSDEMSALRIEELFGGTKIRSRWIAVILPLDLRFAGEPPSTGVNCVICVTDTTK